MILVEGPRSFWVATQASIVNETMELAWAEPLIRHDPHLRWIVGRYVEADTPNKNGHIFPLDQLKANVGTIPHKPLNMLHLPNRIIGHYVGAELMYPTTGEGAAAAVQKPFVETLAAAYAWYFPEQVKALEAAHAEGSLSQSMEITPDHLQCPTCDKTFAYMGRSSPTYCACLQQPGAAKRLLGGAFSGGGLIIPPAAPAWPGADITDLRAWMDSHVAELEAASVYDQVANDFSHLDAKQWEIMMAQLMHQAETAAIAEYGAKYSQMQRMQMAKDGKALKDGSYPVADAQDLHSAIVLCQSGHGDVAAAKAHIIKRAKAMGMTNMLPDDWK